VRGGSERRADADADAEERRPKTFRPQPRHLGIAAWVAMLIYTSARTAANLRKDAAI